MQNKVTQSLYFLFSTRLTLAVMIPFVLTLTGVFGEQGFNIGLGALSLGLLDGQSVFERRFYWVLWTTFVISSCVLITTLLFPQGIFLGIVLLFLVFGISMLPAGGGLGSSMSVSVMLAITFAQDEIRTPFECLLTAASYGLGGLWYALVVFLLWYTKPYRHVEILIENAIDNIQNYLNKRFEAEKKSSKTAQESIIQIEYKKQAIDSIQELREAILLRRSFVQGKTTAGRKYVLALRSIADFFDAIHSFRLPDEKSKFRTELYQVFDEFDSSLELLKMWLQNPTPNFEVNSQEAHINQLMKNLDEWVLEHKYENAENILNLKNAMRNLLNADKALQRLVNILNNKVHVINSESRVKTLEALVKEKKSYFNIRKVWDNFNLESNRFRFAVRFTTAYLSAFLLSHLLNLEQGYWLMLTIVVLVKPDYSVTMSRIFQRILGTLAGGTIGFLMLHFLAGSWVLIILMIFSASMSFYFFKKKYVNGVFFLTIYILLLYGYYGGADDLKNNITILRIVNTLVGAMLALVVSMLVFPEWQRRVAPQLIEVAVQRTEAHLIALRAWVLEGKDAEYRMARKQAHISISNLMESFRSNLKDPVQVRVDSNSYYSVLIFIQYIENCIINLANQHKVLSMKKPMIEFSKEFDHLKNQFSDVHFNIDKNKAVNYTTLNPEIIELKKSIYEKVLNASSKAEKENESSRYILLHEFGNLSQKIKELIRPIDKIRESYDGK